MLSNDALHLNLRLFVTFEHGLEKIRIVANTNVPPLSVMGVTDLGHLQDVLEAGDIDHHLVCSGDVLLGNFTVQAVEKSPKSMVERRTTSLCAQAR